MLDFSKPPEQLLNECLAKIADLLAKKKAASIEMINAIFDDNVAEAAYHRIRAQLTLDAKNGDAEKQLQGIGKITDTIAEAWMKTQSVYLDAVKARDDAQGVKWASQQKYYLIEEDIKLAYAEHYAALAILNKDTRLALTQT